MGHDDGGQLTEAVRRKPYSVILFDEVEKAHPDVFNVLLQLLDDGRLTDSKGRTVDFRNTMVIMTSNIGSQRILENRVKRSVGDIETDDVMEAAVMTELRSHFRPEFLNRIDDIVFFESLTPVHLARIVRIQMKTLENRLAKRAITLTISDDAREQLALMGFDPVYGARPLKRIIRRHLENPLAQALIERQFEDGDTIAIALSPATDKPDAAPFIFSKALTSKESTQPVG